MREEGDYIDWYCSGIGNKNDGYGLSGTEPMTDAAGRQFVPEGFITDEIEHDLNNLGWIPIPYKDDE
jgi:hypothetical protein